MNHADLLRRYIAHVRSCEGVAFLYDDQRWESAREGITFTDDEWALLCSLESHQPST